MGCAHVLDFPAQGAARRAALPLALAAGASHYRGVMIFGEYRARG
jgi:hypothetical protein